MSLSDNISQASFSAQETVYSDPVLFEDEEGNYTIEAKGIFKSQYTLVDSMTQQEVVSDVPTVWIRRPHPIQLAQGQKLKTKEKYYQIKEIHSDIDENCDNLLLHEIASPDAN